ncbi:glyoxysomal processing protease [Citrus sinensis]|nr:glyoxysomal processing protease [Citrus sinensis]
MAEFSRNFGVLVRVQGPFSSGKTTLSASGMLLPLSFFDTKVAERNWGVNGLIVTVASVVEPFLLPQYRDKDTSEGQPELISGSQIDFLVEGKLRSEKEHEDVDKGSPEWVTAQLMMLVDIPVSSLALQSLMEASSGLPEHEWEVGWSLAPYNNSSQPLMGVVKTSDLPNIALTPLNKRGDLLLAVGSPFGVLSPMHFFNSVSMGSVANCYPPRSTTRSLLMADIRCLPGMEGGPVFGEHAHFVGILIRPLRQKSGAEIQLVIPWEAIATACSDLLLKEPQNAEKEIHINKGNLNAVGNSLLFNSHILNGACCYKYEHVDSRCRSPLPIQKALASVCLITIDDGVWASGVLLNDRGLILTNAHLLEPWRFGKTTVSGWRNGVSFQPEDSASSGHTGVDQYQKSQTLPPKMPKIVDSSVDEHRAYKLSSFSRGHRKIRVRLDHLDPWIWCDAKIVYVCKGPLDVSLLQLGYIPDQLCPIDADFGQPSLGSAAYVIGHGLFGPRCGLSPSVSSGVVAKVVKANLPSYGQSTLQRNSAYPVMLETTAAVHPGGSGGAVVNLDGHMIGLVTSNARHGGGTVIPHLNFSIPCAVLRPIFEFARDMQEVSLLRKLDEPNKHLASVWALMPPLSPKQGPSLPDLPQAALEDNIEGKGSRFAKFIAERREVLKHSTQVGNAERVSGEIFRSKL